MSSEETFKIMESSAWRRIGSSENREIYRSTVVEEFRENGLDGQIAWMSKMGQGDGWPQSISRQ